jgi:3D (Asp-Asp-Asp) domain-containing protein
LPGAEGAGPKGGAGSLRQQQKGLAARSQTALLSLYALDSRLARARSELAGLRSRAQGLKLEREQVRQEIEVVAGNLKASQRLLGDRLRALYEEGEPDAIAILLGATSLDDAVTRLDELERSARQGAQAARDSQDGQAKLQGLALELAARIREVQALEGQAARTTSVLESARAHRVSYLEALARQQRLTARQIAALDSRARQVVAKAQVVQSQAAATPGTAPAASVVDGARTLTVTSSGYSMPGRTATGLPVGPGIVAVDPAVIPLGTRLSIPGYGEGVAADTGGAVQGLTIDLWFPTLAEALAWGRRTVTITLH